MACVSRAAQTLDERYSAGRAPDAAGAAREFPAAAKPQLSGRAPAAQLPLSAGADAVFALEALLAGSMSLQGLPVSLLTAYAGCLAAAVAALALERRLDRKLVGGMLLYPVFMACFLPLQTLALFKTQTIWHEIRHSGVRLAAEVDLRRGKIA